MTLAIELPIQLEKRLTKLAKKTHRSENSFVSEAVEAYLVDQEDYYDSLAVRNRIAQGKEELYTLEEVKKLLGDDDKSSI